MPLRSLDTVKNQVESTAKNMAANTVAQFNRATSITGWANSLCSRAMQSAARTAQMPRRSDVYIMSEEELRVSGLTGEEPFTAPDGYVRKSPVQALVIPPDYRKKLVQKWIVGVLAVAAVCAAVYALVAMGFIGI